jgi:2-(1,2-epoxy-1,2-dihydrophenyl)acetyl-CoA isomerase
MSDAPLLIDRDGAVLTLTLNRPDALNALNISLKDALRRAVYDVRTDTDCRAVVITGAGRAFCVGQDLREHMDSLERSGTDDNPLSTVVEHYNPLIRALAELDRPVIAAVRGLAAGAGAALAFLADFRVGGPTTAFLTAFAGVGLAADSGASWTLPRLIGRGRATELLMLSEPVGAEEAHRIGLLNRLVDDDAKVLQIAQELATRLAAGPTVAYAQIKRELAAAAVGTLGDALDAEARAQAICGATADHRDAAAAFLRKERPRFTGH